MKFKKKYLGIILLLGVMLSACGYRFAGSGALPGGTKTIFVDVFKNQTAETGIENIFTEDFRYEFIRSKIFAGQDEAEAILSGEIRSLRVQTISRKDQITSQERRVYASINLKLKNPQGEVIWSADGITDSEAYEVTAGDKTVIDINKRNAIRRLSKKLAEAVYYRLTDNF